jgi:hypothetical protein
MKSVTEIGSALEALQTKALSVGQTIDRQWTPVDDALEAASKATADMRFELWIAADSLAGEEGGADVARQLRELAGQFADLQVEIEQIRARADYVLSEWIPPAEALEDFVRSTCAPDSPADAGGGAKGDER